MDKEHVSKGNPTGCLQDLQSAITTTYSTPPGGTPHDTGQTMAFFNMQEGDAPFFKSLADTYTMSDNYHQPVLGGTGPDSQPLGFAKLLCGVALCAMAVNAVAPVAAAAAQSGSNDGNTTTPIKHVIVIIGENRTFDHLFATYQPVKKNETVLNLLSQGIVNADGTPGRTIRASLNFRRRTRPFIS